MFVMEVEEESGRERRKGKRSTTPLGKANVALGDQIRAQTPPLRRPGAEINDAGARPQTTHRGGRITGTLAQTHGDTDDREDNFAKQMCAAFHARRKASQIGAPVRRQRGRGVSGRGL